MAFCALGDDIGTGTQTFWRVGARGALVTWGN